MQKWRRVLVQLITYSGSTNETNTTWLFFVSDTGEFTIHVIAKQAHSERVAVSAFGLCFQAFHCCEICLMIVFTWMFGFVNLMLYMC